MSTIATIERTRASRIIPGGQLADRKLFLAAAIGFAALILVGYSRTYYLAPLFNAKPLANHLVHAHALTMSMWVVYFALQVFLVRTKNVRLHMTLGMTGIGLAALVIVVGMATAIDSHIVRKHAPPGIDPYGFFAIAGIDMLNFVILLTAAILYRRRPAEHKSLMFLTVINFLPAAIVRIPLLPPEFAILHAYAIPDVLALAGFGYYTWKQRKLNKAFLLGLLLVIFTQPLRIYLLFSPAWASMMHRLLD